MTSIRVLTANLNGKRGTAAQRRSMVNAEFTSSDIIFTQEQSFAIQLDGFKSWYTEETGNLKNNVYVRQSCLGDQGVECRKLVDQRLLDKVNNSDTFTGLFLLHARFCAVWVTLFKDKMPALLVSYHGAHQSCSGDRKVELAQRLLTFARLLASKEQERVRDTRQPIIIIGGDWNIEREAVASWDCEGKAHNWYCEDYQMTVERRTKKKIDYFISNVPCIPKSTGIVLHYPNPDYECLDHDMVASLYNIKQRMKTSRPTAPSTRHREKGQMSVLSPVKWKGRTHQEENAYGPPPPANVAGRDHQNTIPKMETRRVQLPAKPMTTPTTIPTVSAIKDEKLLSKRKFGHKQGDQTPGNVKMGETTLKMSTRQPQFVSHDQQKTQHTGKASHLAVKPKATPSKSQNDSVTTTKQALNAASSGPTMPVGVWGPQTMKRKDAMGKDVVFVDKTNAQTKQTTGLFGIKHGKGVSHSTGRQDNTSPSHVEQSSDGFRQSLAKLVHERGSGQQMMTTKGKQQEIAKRRILKRP